MGTYEKNPVTFFVYLYALLPQYFSDAGILVIVLNYTGDILNFGSAVEEAKSYNINVSLPYKHSR